MNQLNLLTDDGGTRPGFTLALGERPQARMENHGVNSLSDTELIAMLLTGSGMTPDTAVVTSSRLIAEAGSLAGLGSSFFGGGYVDQKCRPQRGHTQNWSGVHGMSGPGSRKSISVPQR